MTSLLKNQILKHLSKFTKGLSPDKLSVSAIKGEGELSNLELDEGVLTDLLELPTWLKITSATCNRVAVKIQWTKLKSQPICLYLDEVVVTMETCEVPRAPNTSSSRSPLSSGGKYGFIDKVMDGIYVHVNSVSVKMVSRTFSASLQLSRVKVHSTTPAWGATNDLRSTRIRDGDRGEILLFKEIEWQTTRIEATADESLPQELLTPLRLIANQAKIRIVVKKRLSDCSIMASRVMLLLDDLLWVLTITQLKAAILYANSLKQVIERSSQQSKMLAAEKLKRQGIMGGSTTHQPQSQRSQSANTASNADKIFARFDVATTSYHLVTSRFDLHLCDDTTTTSDAKRHWDVAGGSMQITFYRLSFDFYPFHPAGGERKSWFRYSDNIGTRNNWVQKLFTSFREDAVKLRKVCGSPAPSPSTSSSKLVSAAAGTNMTGTSSANTTPSHSPSHAAASATRSPQASAGHQAAKVNSPSHHASQPQQKSTRLLESCVVIKVEDLTIYMVSTPGAKRSGHQKFLASDKKQLHLPADMSLLHMEYTDYYFPDGVDYPVPHANLYILVNPVRVTVDFLTLLWSQYFLFSLAHNVEFDLGERGPQEHIDIKLEALMPRLIVPSEEKVEGQPDRPDALQMQISKLTCSNCRVDDKLGRSDLQRALDRFYSSQLFHTSEFPNDATRYRLSLWVLEEHAASKDNPYLDQAVKALLALDPTRLQPDSSTAHVLTCSSLKKDAANDVWGLHLEQVWVEFLGVQTYKNRPVPCVEAFPLTLWFTENISSSPSYTDFHSKSSERPERRGSRSNSPTPPQRRVSQQEDAGLEKRPNHLPLGQTKTPESHATESFEDSHSLQSEERGEQHSKTAMQAVFVLSHFGSKMRVQVNHFQYLFLMRLAESFAKFQEDLSGLWGGSSFACVTHIPVTFPQGELAIICPYQMHQRTFSDDFSPSIQNLPDVFSVANGNGVGSGDSQPLLETTSIPACNAEESEPTELVFSGEREVLFSNASSSTIESNTAPSVTGYNNSCQQNSMTYMNSSQSRASPDITSVQNQQTGTTPSPNPADVKSSLMSTSAGTDSGIGLDRKPSLKSAKASKGSEVKKAFSSAFSNLTDKIKNTFDDGQSDDVDSMSIRTDTSDDDDFEQLSLDDADEVPAFVHEVHSETGSNPDTYSDMDMSSLYADSSTTKGREMVSLVLLRLEGVHLVLQVTNDATVLAGQICQAVLHQPGNVAYDEFYGKFSSPKGFLQDEIPASDSPPRFPIKFRYVLPAAPMVSTVTISPDQPQSPKEPAVTTATVTAAGEATIRIEDFSLRFKMSGMTLLSDFIEDERAAQVIPLAMTIRHFLLVLEEDRLDSSGSSPSGLPTNCHIDHLYISRGADGIYNLTTKCASSHHWMESSLGADDTDTFECRGHHTPSSSSSLTLLTHTQVENSQLRRQCDELQRANKLYEEQILVLKDKLRGYDHQLVAKQQVQEDHPQVSEVAVDPVVSATSVGQATVDTEVETEKLLLQERIINLEEELQTSAQEKDSLIATLHFLQEELLKSENRGRSNTTH